MLVGEQLNLDVPGPFEVALEVDAVVAEGGLGLASCGCDRVVELGGRADDAHPAAAAAGGRLDDQRRLARLRDRRHSRAGRDPLRCELVAAGAQRLRRRPDPGQARRRDRLGEVAVLGEEAVAGMDRVGAELAAPRGGAPRGRGTSRSRSRRRPSARAATRGRRLRRPRPRRDRARAPRGRRAGRSPRDWRPAPSARADPSRRSAGATGRRTSTRRRRTDRGRALRRALRERLRRRLLRRAPGRAPRRG